MKQNNEHINKGGFLKRNRETLNVIVFFVAILLVSIYILNLVQNKHQRNILGGVYQYSSYEIPGSLNNTPSNHHTTSRSHSRSNSTANMSLPNGNMGVNHPNAVNASSNFNTTNSLGGSVLSTQKVRKRTSSGGSDGSFAGAGVAVARSSNNRGRSGSGNSANLPSSSSTSLNDINSSSTPSSSQLGVNNYQPGKGGTDPGGNPNKKNKLPIKNGNVFLIVSALLYGGYKYYSIRKKEKNKSLSSSK